MSFFHWGNNAGNDDNNEDRSRVIRRVLRHRMSAGIDSKTGRILPSILEQPLEELPMSVDEMFHRNGYMLPSRGWDPILRTICKGIRDEMNCPPISLLRGYEDTIVRNIFSYLPHPWSKHIKLTIPASLVGSNRGQSRIRHVRQVWNHRNFARRPIVTTNRISTGFEDGFVAYARVGSCKFPQPTNIHVDMLPFRFGDIMSLPKHLCRYHSLIEACPYSKSEKGKVGYLTVHEGYVHAGETQRPAGLHIQRPGMFRGYCDDKNKNENEEDNGKVGYPSSFQAAVEYSPSGVGIFNGSDRYEGGIYLATSTGRHVGACRVWDALIDNRVPGIVDDDGHCENLRHVIGGRGKVLRDNELIWITDCTPYESVPQKDGGYCQFFQVTGPNISHWYEDYSTPNPDCPLPNHVIKVTTSTKKRRNVSDDKNTATTTNDDTKNVDNKDGENYDIWKNLWNIF